MPAGHVVVFIFQHQLAVFVVVHLIDDFRPVDGPDVSQFGSVEVPDLYTQAVVANVLEWEYPGSLDPLGDRSKLQQVRTSS